MPAGLLFAVAMLADPAPAYGPAQDGPSKPPAKTAVEPCSSTRPSAGSDEIVVCVERPQGYRLNPDVIEAKRALRHQRPRPRTNEKLGATPTLCDQIGGCSAAESIDWINTAIVLGSMAVKAAEGENVGKMFVTRPEPSEYQLYLEAKRAREAKEAEAAVESRLKAKAEARAVQDVSAAAEVEPDPSE